MLTQIIKFQMGGMTRIVMKGEKSATRGERKNKNNLDIKKFATIFAYGKIRQGIF